MSDNSQTILKEPSVIYVRPISGYLREIRAIEQRKPKHLRRSVPTLQELGEKVGVSGGRLSQLHRGTSLKLSLASAIVDEMYRRGFPMKLTDLMGYKPPVLLEPEPRHEPSESSSIEALVSEYINADEQKRQKIWRDMPRIAEAIERQMQ